LRVLPDPEIDVARCLGLMAEASYKLADYSDAADTYLKAINLAKENGASLHLICHFWTECGFAELHLDKAVARVCWREAAEACTVLQEEANVLLRNNKREEFRYKREEVKRHIDRINELYSQL
jgi:hypothetical protein